MTLKRIVSILFLCFAMSVQAARQTTVICSIIKNGKTPVECIVYSTSWSGDNGTITLQFSVPLSVRRGDVIQDSAGNSYLITAWKDRTLTCQDFSTTTDPATGSATIYNAYNTITTWEAALDNTIIYRLGDNAIGECYATGGDFTTSLTINGGGTVGLSSIRLTAHPDERHDGTAGTGVKLYAGSGNTPCIKLQGPGTLPVTVEWLEISSPSWQGTGIVHINNRGTVRNCIIHSNLRANTSIYGIYIASSGSTATMMNNMIYDLRSSAPGVFSSGLFFYQGGVGLAYNNSLYSCEVVASVHGVASGAGSYAWNNIACGTIGGVDFLNKDADINMDYNVSSDGTATNGVHSQTGKAAAIQYVSIVAGSEDLHMKSGSAAINRGYDLGTTPSGVNIDIDGHDRDADGGLWDIGAHECWPTQWRLLVDGNDSVNGLATERK